MMAQYENFTLLIRNLPHGFTTTELQALLPQAPLTIRIISDDAPRARSDSADYRKSLALVRYENSKALIEALLALDDLIQDGNCLKAFDVSGNYVDKLRIRYIPSYFDDKTLKNLLVDQGAIVHVNVMPPNLNPGSDNCGYGFVQYKSTADAYRALLRLGELWIVEDKQLEVLPAHPPGIFSKVMVRNMLPTWKVEKDIHRHFLSYGRIERVLWPNKTSTGDKGKKKGYAFVIFIIEKTR